MHAFLLAVLALSAHGAASANPCTNGSFEELAPSGFPADWERVGQAIEAVSDAHSGQRSLRLVRGEDALKGGLQTTETGLNRAWKAHSGERGAMIGRLKGGIEFWYKAISATDSTKLTVQAIPMTAEPIEQTESPRAIFTVPKEHVGDGQWHQGRLKYDFTSDPKARWVHFAARILGRAGELLLDDFSYIEQVGPILRLSRVRLDEDPKKPGERCTISALIENVGDAPAPDVRAALTAPPELRATPAELRLGDLGADAKAKAVWTLCGRRASPLVLPLRAEGGTIGGTTSIRLVPDLLLESFGPVTPVGTAGVPLRVEAVLRNLGHAIATNVTVEFDVSCYEPLAPKAIRAVGDLRPGERRSVQFTYLAQADNTAASAATEGRVTVCAANVGGQLTARAVLVVGPNRQVPAPSGRLQAVSTDAYALLENEHVRLIFRRARSGFGPGEFQARVAGGWRTVAWMPRLGGFQYRLPGAKDGVESRIVDLGFAGKPEASTGQRAQLCFRFSGTGQSGTTRTARCFALGKGDKCFVVDREFAHDPACELESLSTWVYALERDEAVFPGLEWLIGDELSSSALDIAEGHPDRLRRLVHPNMVAIPALGVRGGNGVVGLLWDPCQKWDGERDRPSVRFASPDRLCNERSHLMELLLPPVPEFREQNQDRPTRGCPLMPNQPVRLQCRIFADGEAKDALAAVDEWIRSYGLPEPQPLPHGSYEKEIEFSMQGYLKSLWVPETKEWWTSKGGGPIMSKKGRPHNFVADLLLGALVSPDEAVRKQCRERAEEVAPLLKTEPRLDAMRFPGRFDLAIANPAHAAGLLATMGDDGAWRFDADQEGRGPFVGMDYHELGPDNAVEVGTCANKAFQVLRYARIAGDAEAYDRMQKTLRLMETFRVPRAAQVWEVPVHTPDLLAAADAADAYIEAYRFSGDERWLRDAVTWARRGIPFIYLWNPSDKPWLLGASIPVYGATWFTCSWFGRPVQWNGLRYATAILKLAEYDQSKDWRRLAELIIRSAILQQDPDGDNVALWPDNISAIDGTKCPWVFAPRQIIQNILLLNGRDEEPQTTILTHKPFLRSTRRIHISATAKVSDAAWDGDLLTFKAAYPQGEEGCILITNVARPTKVLLDAKPLAERPDVEKGVEPGWRYDDGLAYLSIRIGPPAAVASYGLKAALQAKALGIEGARHRRVDRLPTLAERLDFSFNRSAEGWMAAHDIAGLAVRDGALCGRATANDPYIVRSLVRVKGDACPVLLIRMRSTAGTTAQFFWTTESSPAFDEAKSLRFPLIADGQFHDYRLDVGERPEWAGQTITAVRLDPSDSPGEFAVDHIRGAARR